MTERAVYLGIDTHKARVEAALAEFERRSKRGKPWWLTRRKKGGKKK